MTESAHRHTQMDILKIHKPVFENEDHVVARAGSIYLAQYCVFPVALTTSKENLSETKGPLVQQDRHRLFRSLRIFAVLWLPFLHLSASCLLPSAGAFSFQSKYFKTHKKYFNFSSDKRRGWGRLMGCGGSTTKCYSTVHWMAI